MNWVHLFVYQSVLSVLTSNPKNGIQINELGSFICIPSVFVMGLKRTQTLAKIYYVTSAK